MFRKVIKGFIIFVVFMAVLDVLINPEPKADNATAQQTQATAAQSEPAKQAQAEAAQQAQAVAAQTGLKNPEQKAQEAEPEDPCKDITPERWKEAGAFWRITNAECDPEDRAEKARREREAKEFEEWKPVLEKKFDARIREVLKKMPAPGEYTLKLTMEKNDYSATVIYAVDPISMADAQITARIALLAMLEMLLEQGVNPSVAGTWASVWVYSEAKGVTGKELIRAYGNTRYNHFNDSIEWKPRR